MNYEYPTEFSEFMFVDFRGRLIGYFTFGKHGGVTQPYNYLKENELYPGIFEFYFKGEYVNRELGW
jgi:hypothetical protein